MINSVILKSPASVTGVELRQILLAALGGSYNADSDTWSSSATAMIPAQGNSPGSEANAGKQITNLLYSGTQAEIESDLQNAGLQPHQVIGMQSFDSFLVPDSDPPEYLPIVYTYIEGSTLVYLSKRYESDGTTEINPSYDWISTYAGQSPWQGV